MAKRSEDFVIAQSDNLPKVDLFMVMQYITNSDCYNSAEIKGWKAMRSTRQDYIKCAIGYVQLQRIGELCTIKGQICPEHKIKSKNYAVSMTINEVEEEILNVTCHDCSASQGGCKHILAFLTWVHEKSNEPSTTEVQCYWKKPRLSLSNTDTQFITTKDFGRSLSFNVPGTSTFLNKFIEKAAHVENNSNCHLLKYFKECGIHNKLSLHHLIITYVANSAGSAVDFLKYASNLMNDRLCQQAEEESKLQHKCNLWYELRYGRITASKIYEATPFQKE
ncbi:hypothetical protein FQR65_LT19317 [Abscondita terminalis]|nr:hypothetical protein FQR65_LT19317 [Abscondita terminalis]